MGRGWVGGLLLIVGRLKEERGKDRKQNRHPKDSQKFTKTISQNNTDASGAFGKTR